MDEDEDFSLSSDSAMNGILESSINAFNEFDEGVESTFVMSKPTNKGKRNTKTQLSMTPSSPISQHAKTEGPFRPLSFASSRSRAATFGIPNPKQPSVSFPASSGFMPPPKTTFNKLTSLTPKEDSSSSSSSSSSSFSSKPPKSTSPSDFTLPLAPKDSPLEKFSLKQAPIQKNNKKPALKFSNPPTLNFLSSPTLNSFVKTDEKSVLSSQSTSPLRIKEPRKNNPPTQNSGDKSASSLPKFNFQPALSKSKENPRGLFQASHLSSSSSPSRNSFNPPPPLALPTSFSFRNPATKNFGAKGNTLKNNTVSKRINDVSSEGEKRNSDFVRKQKAMEKEIEKKTNKEKLKTKENDSSEEGGGEEGRKEKEKEKIFKSIQSGMEKEIEHENENNNKNLNDFDGNEDEGGNRNDINDNFNAQGNFDRSGNVGKIGRKENEGGVELEKEPEEVKDELAGKFEEAVRGYEEENIMMNKMLQQMRDGLNILDTRVRDLNEKQILLHADYCLLDNPMVRAEVEERATRLLERAQNYARKCDEAVQKYV